MIIKQQLNRDSNAELLRLICMFMIILHHFAHHVMYTPEMLTQAISPVWDYYLVHYSHCLYFIGVNCFILISGYFAIKPSVRGFLNLYLTYSFYGLFIGLYTLQKLDYSTIHSITYVLECTFLPFSTNGLWFLTCYLVLYCLSPLINIGCESLSKRYLTYMLLVLSLINVYMGNIRAMEMVNQYGFCIMQFIYMYFIGRYIKLYVPIRVNLRYTYLLIYLLCAALWAGQRYITDFNTSRLLNWLMWKELAYNNLFVIGAAISFFLFVMSFNFKSKPVNWLALSCLSLYIVQDYIYTSDFSNVCFKEFTYTLTPWVRLTCLLAVTCVVWLVPLLVDKIRMLITTPVLNLSSRGVEILLHKRLNQC